MSNSLKLWHRFVETQAPEHLDDLLDDDVLFHSPFVWKPKEGKEITKAILVSVTTVFEEFRYVREFIDESDWALEFEAGVGDLTLRGVDLIKLNDEGKIIDLEVMIRPANALQAVGMAMTQKLAEQRLV